MKRRLLMVMVVLVVFPVVAFAGHSWGSYHWKRTSSAQLNLPIHDNLDAKWETYLQAAHGDWNASTVLENTLFMQSPLSSQKRCTSATGKIEVCNDRYGQNGWLGIAGISASGGHITKGYTKLNDTYFDTATYNTPAWRAMVTCQEIGHDFGLDHQDETFDNVNLGTCMDYTNDPDGGAGGASSNDPSNERPNKHDYDQLLAIYNHTDAASVFNVMAMALSRPQSISEIMADAGQWGAPIQFDGHGRPNVFLLPVGVNSAGEHEVELTHVLWAPIDPFEKDEERGRNRKTPQ